MTRRVALIGKPLRRRHSEVMHNAAFAACGIDARFVLREIDEDELPGFVAEAHGPAWLGFGVTAPYKRAVMELVDEVEPAARAIGAINNAVCQGGRVVGFNTDSIGFASAVYSELGMSLAGAQVVLLGAGGAAHAVAYACLEGDAAGVTVASRRVDAARALTDRLAPGAPHVSTCALDDPVLDTAIAGADLLVNATTVGMIDPGPPVAPEGLPDTAAVFDLVYVPAETDLVRRSRARGLAACNGVGMLVAQGVAAFERWTGVGGVAEVMRRAIEPLLADDNAKA